MEYTVSVVALLLVVALRHRQIESRESPDCRYYLKLAGGTSVPAPYAYRPVLPMVARGLSKLFRVQVNAVFRGLVLSGNLAVVALTYLLTLELGGGPLAAFTAAICVVMSDSAFGIWVMFPWLVDSFSLALALAAVIIGGWWGVGLALLAALTKEGPPLVAAAFIIIIAPASLFSWLTAAAACAGIALTRIVISPAEPDQDWLRSPFVAAQTQKWSLWFAYIKNLSGMKGLPIAAAYWLPSSDLAYAALAAVFIAWAQTLAAMDHARLIAISIPFLAAVTCTSMSSNWLGLLICTMIFWPFQSDAL